MLCRRSKALYTVALRALQTRYTGAARMLEVATKALHRCHESAQKRCTVAARALRGCYTRTFKIARQPTKNSQLAG